MASVPTSNQGVTDIAQLQQINNVIYVRQFLFPRNMSRLAQERRENQCLPDRGCSLVHVHLLAVSRRALETNSLRPAVNQNRSIDLAAILALRQHIKKSVANVSYVVFMERGRYLRRLSRTGTPH